MCVSVAGKVRGGRRVVNQGRRQAGRNPGQGRGGADAWCNKPTAILKVRGSAGRQAGVMRQVGNPVAEAGRQQRREGARGRCEAIQQVQNPGKPNPASAAESSVVQVKNQGREAQARERTRRQAQAGKPRGGRHRQAERQVRQVAGVRNQGVTVCGENQSAGSRQKGQRRTIRQQQQAARQSRRGVRAEQAVNQAVNPVWPTSNPVRGRQSSKG